MWRGLLATLCCSVALADSSFELDNACSPDLPSKLIDHIISHDFFHNDLTSIIVYGDNFPSQMFSRLMELHVCVLRLADEGQTHKPPATSRPTALPGLVVLRVRDLLHFSRALLVLTRLNDWNPHAKVIVHLESGVTDVEMSRIFFTFWWHTVTNVIVFHVENLHGPDTIVISRYTPFAYDGFRLDHNYWCWSDKGFGQVRSDVVKRTTCQIGCQVVARPPENMFFPTCISFERFSVKSDQRLNDLGLFPDRARDLNGFPLTTFTNAVPPFTKINRDKTGLDFISGRDPSIWKAIAKHLNFTMELQRADMMLNFSYNTAIRKIIEMSNRKLEVCAFPVYRLIPPPLHIEMTYTYQSSGLCYVTRRSELLSFYINMQPALLIDFITTYFMVLITFMAIISTRDRTFSWVAVGRSWSYTTRIFLIMPLNWLPRGSLVRFAIIIILMGAFLMNYMMQSVLTSSLAVKKRPDNMNSFGNVADSGLLVYGLDSPDVVLPDTDETFQKINDRFRPIQDFTICINWLRRGRHVICIVECSTADYLAMNEMDDRGRTFLHVLADRIHNDYLSFIVPKHSPLLKHIDKFLMVAEQAGLIIKWRNTQFEKAQSDMPEMKPLSVKDVQNILTVFGFSTLLSIVIFLGEVLSKICHRRIFYQNAMG